MEGSSYGKRLRSNDSIHLGRSKSKHLNNKERRKEGRNREKEGREEGEKKKEKNKTA